MVTKIRATRQDVLDSLDECIKKLDHTDFVGSNQIIFRVGSDGEVYSVIETNNTDYPDNRTLFSLKMASICDWNNGDEDNDELENRMDESPEEFVSIPPENEMFENLSFSDDENEEGDNEHSG